MHDYVFDRCEDFHRSGARVVALATRDLAGGFVEIDAILVFGRDEDALLQVWELLVQLDSGQVHRLQYSYQFMARDQFFFRYDRDPVNHPEMTDHKHLPPDRRIDSGSVTFREVLEEAFAVVARTEADGDE